MTKNDTETECSVCPTGSFDHTTKQATSRHTSKLLQTGRRVPVQTMHTTDTQK